MDIVQIQRLLKALGFDPGPADGIWGKKTQAALDAACGKHCGQDFWADIRHFQREEFRCKCGGKYCNGFPQEPQEGMAVLADAAREHFGRPARVVSGLRCPLWNTKQGGVEGSRHLSGKACDLCIPGVSGQALLEFFKKQPGVRYAYRISGCENVHFDIE